MSSLVIPLAGNNSGLHSGGEDNSEFENFVLETVQMETSIKKLGLKDWKEHYCSGKFSSVIMYAMLRKHRKNI